MALKRRNHESVETITETGVRVVQHGGVRKAIAAGATPNVAAARGQGWRAAIQNSLAVMKPITWFAPMWAYLCGAVAAGNNFLDLESVIKLSFGIILAGPILTGISQVVNDYCDRDVDAINEPQRLIPSGVVGTAQVYITIGVLALLGLVIPLYLGRPVVLLAALGFGLALVYSVHPLRAKRNGWIGNALVAIAYEGLPWIAGNATFAPNGHMQPSFEAITGLSYAAALLYSLGAHGIMTINDFKSVEGDRPMGIKTIPVLYGEQAAAWIAIVLMNVAQVAVIAIQVMNGLWISAAVVGVLLVAQAPLQRTFLKNPKDKAPWYNATGTTLFVYGMLATAIGIR